MVFLLVVFVTQMDTGYLSVHADQDSLPIYVDNDYIGKTPVNDYPLTADRYTVGFFPEDSIEAASWRVKNGSIRAIWQLARFGEGVAKVDIAPNRSTTVRLDYGNVVRAPGRAKLKVAAVLAGSFMLGVLSVLAVQAAF